MNNLKMYMALIALMFPLLVCAKERRVNIELEHKGHRASTELLIPVKASIDDYNKELTIEFFQEWEPVTIEIKNADGITIYQSIHIPQEGDKLIIPLENFSAKLIISDRTQTLTGTIML